MPTYTAALVHANMWSIPQVGGCAAGWVHVRVGALQVFGFTIGG